MERVIESSNCDFNRHGNCVCGTIKGHERDCRQERGGRSGRKLLAFLRRRARKVVCAKLGRSRLCRATTKGLTWVCVRVLRPTWVNAPRSALPRSAYREGRSECKGQQPPMHAAPPADERGRTGGRKCRRAKKRRTDPPLHSG